MRFYRAIPEVPGRPLDVHALSCIAAEVCYDRTEAKDLYDIKVSLRDDKAAEVVYARKHKLTGYLYRIDARRIKGRGTIIVDPAQWEVVTFTRVLKFVEGMPEKIRGGSDAAVTA